MQAESNPEIESKTEDNPQNEANGEFPWRIRLGTFLGLPLYFHITFFLWLFGLFWVEKTDLVLYVSLIFFSIGIHELAHALACRYFGFGGGTLTVWLLGGFFLPFSELTLFEMSRKQRIQYALMIFAGPLSNLVLAAIFIGVAYLTSMSQFEVAAMFNLGLAIFNLLPVGRLDGGNMVIYLGTTVFHWRKVMIAVSVLSFVVALGIAVSMFIDSWIGRYSNSVGIFIGMGIASIRMSQQTEESIKSESIKLIQKEKIFVERTQKPSLFGKALTLGLIGMLAYSVGLMASYYYFYNELTGRIVFADLGGDYDERKMYIVDGMGFPRVAAEDIPEDYYFQISSSSDGKFLAFSCVPSHVYYRQDGVTSICVDDSKGKLLAEIPLTGKFRMANFHLSPEGRRILVSTVENGVWMIDWGTMQMQNIYPDGGIHAWAPDGSSVLIVQKINDNLEIIHLDLANNKAANLSNNPKDDFSPIFSNDGQKIYFVSDRYGEDSLFVMNLDGSGLSMIPLQNPIYTRNSPVQISPTNLQIAFECGYVGDIICVANIDGSNEKKLADGEYPVWSPDGKYITYVSTYKKKGIFLIETNGDNPFMLAPLRNWASKIVWLP
jgi:Zn-dependent protease